MSGARPRATAGPSEHVERAAGLTVGDRVAFWGERHARFKVQARGERYIVLTRPCFGSYLYTVIDLQEGVRGPDDSWGTGYESGEEIAEALAKLEAGDAAISQRRALSLLISNVVSAE